MHRPSPGYRAFSLIELLTVLCIMLIMIGVVAPSISGLLRANGLNNASRLVSNLLTVARTEAVTKRAKTRFAVVRDWPGQSDADFRKMSIWRQESGQTDWVQITKWEKLPQGVVFDTNSSSYPPAAAADNLLSTTAANSFEIEIGGKTVDLQYAEFLPNGGASMPSMTGFDIWLALITTPSAPVAAGGHPANWAKITANTLTGRIKVDRP